MREMRETSERCTTMFIRRELRELFPWQMIIESISAVLKANNEKTLHIQENE